MLTAKDARRFFINCAGFEEDLKGIFERIKDAYWDGQTSIEEDLVFEDITSESQELKRIAILQSLKKMGYKVIKKRYPIDRTTNKTGRQCFEISWMDTRLEERNLTIY
jgi:hypothetical protein